MPAGGRARGRRGGSLRDLPVRAQVQDGSVRRLCRLLLPLAPWRRNAPSCWIGVGLFSHRPDVPTPTSVRRTKKQNLGHLL
jgi:hypothetical protein